MPPTLTETLILQRIDKLEKDVGAHEYADDERHHALEAWLSVVNRKLDTLTIQIAESRLEMAQKVGEHGATIRLHSHRLTEVEKEVDSLGGWKSDTGRFQLAEAKAAADKLEAEIKETRRARIEWIMRIVIGVLLMATSMLAGYWIK